MTAARLRGLAALLLVALTACTFGSPASEPTAPARTEPSVAESPQPAAANRALRWAVSALADIVPGDASSPDELLVTRAIFEPLTQTNGAGAASPALAERWTALHDGSTWIFQLAPGARWHGTDGEPGRPVEAADVAFSWNRAAAEGESGFLLRDVKGYEAVADGEEDQLAGVEAVDERTLRVELARPHGAFDVIVSHPSLAPLPRELWREDAGSQRERPIGNGPFRMAEDIVPGRFVRLQAAESWHRSGPGVHELLFQVMEPATGFLAFQQERVHVAQVPPDAISRAVEEHGEAAGSGIGSGVVRQPRPSLLALGVRITAEPFDEAEVRHALSMAVDRDALAETLGAERFEPATSLLLPGLPEGGNDRCDHCHHDPVQAAAVFDERDIDVLTLWLDDEGHDAFGAQLREDLAAVGVRLDVQRLPFAEWVEAVEDGEAGLFRLAWTPEHLTGVDVLDPLLGSDGIWNHTAVADPQLDAELDRARQAHTPGARTRRLRQAEQHALGVGAVVPLLGERQATVVSEDVLGLRLDPLGRTDLAGVRLEEDADGDS